MTFVKSWHKRHVEHLERRITLLAERESTLLRETVLVRQRIQKQSQQMTFVISWHKRHVEHSERRITLLTERELTLFRRTILKSEHALTAFASLMVLPTVYSTIRIRPVAAKSITNICAVHSRGGLTAVELRSKTGTRTYQFDQVFDCRSTARVTSSVVSDLVPMIISGLDLCIAVTGQSGSGKSFTMFEGADAIVPGAFYAILDTLRRRRFVSATFQITCMVTEIYMEQAVILINDTSLKQKSDLTQLLEAVAHQRKLRSTAKNAASSRSHIVIKMDILHQFDNSTNSSTLLFVDLAGSESLPSDNKRDATLELELKGINKGRDAFGQCVRKYKAREVVPWRDSEVGHGCNTG